MPSERNTSSNAAVNLLSRSWIKNRIGSARSTKSSMMFACLLGRPCPGRVRGDARQIHLSSGELDEHEHVEATEQHGVDGEDVAGDDPAGLGPQELPPPFRRASRRRIDPGLLQNRPNGAGRNPNAEPGELALNTAVASRRVLARQPHDQRADTSFGCRPARAPMRIRPATREQRPMPTPDRLRPHEHAAPTLTRKNPHQGGQEHPISRVAAWPAHLSTEHRELMTQDKYLHLVRGV